MRSGQILDVFQMLMLGERSLRNNTYCMIPFLSNFQNYKSIHSNRRLLERGRSGEDGITKGLEDSFRDDGHVNHLDCGDSLMGPYTRPN